MLRIERLIFCLKKKKDFCVENYAMSYFVKLMSLYPNRNYFPWKAYININFLLLLRNLIATYYLFHFYPH